MIHQGVRRAELPPAPEAEPVSPIPGAAVLTGILVTHQGHEPILTEHRFGPHAMSHFDHPTHKEQLIFAN